MRGTVMGPLGVITVVVAVGLIAVGGNVGIIPAFAFPTTMIIRYYVIMLL